MKPATYGLRVRETKILDNHAISLDNSPRLLDHYRFTPKSYWYGHFTSRIDELLDTLTFLLDPARYMAVLCHFASVTSRSYLTDALHSNP